MINVLISGATGAMGKTLIDLIKNNDNFNISAGFAKEYEKLDDFTIYDDIEDIDEKSDVIIDFSSKFSLDPVLSYAKKNSIPLVLASTGYDESDLEKIKKASED